MAYLLPLLPALTPSFASYLGLSPSLTLGVVRIALFGSWAAGLWSRQALGYHTVPQIVVGAALGAGMGVGWKSLWEVGKERGWGVEEGL